MINPWIWHIYNDEMPKLHASGRCLCIFGVWIILLIIWAVGIYCFGECLIGFGHKYFMKYYLISYSLSLGVFVGLSIWLLPKALRKWDK